MNNVAIPYIATGPYIKLWPEFYESAKIYLLPGTEKHFFLFTDSNVEEQPDMTVIHTEQKEWPYMTLHRYAIILSIADRLNDYRYTMFFNANVKFIKECGKEFIPQYTGELIVVKHVHNCFYNGPYPFEHRKESKAYVQSDKSPYIAGGFLSGYTYDFLDLAADIEAKVNVDTARGIVAVWHDESYLNNVYHNANGRIMFRALPECYFNPDNPELESAMNSVIGDKVLVLRDKRRYFDVDELKHVTKKIKTSRSSSNSKRNIIAASQIHVRNSNPS